MTKLANKKGLSFEKPNLLRGALKGHSRQAFILTRSIILTGNQN